MLDRLPMYRSIMIMAFLVLMVMALITCAEIDPRVDSQPRTMEPRTTSASKPTLEKEAVNTRPSSVTLKSKPDSGSQAVNEIVDPRPLVPLMIKRVFPGIAYNEMVFLTNSGDGADRLFLVLQPGAILSFQNERTTTEGESFLDIRERISSGGNEEGLLGLAFDPEFSLSGYFYVYYSAKNPRRSVISRFSVDPKNLNTADPGSELLIMQVLQPYKNHNGGMLEFGPHGNLYIGLGDGGGEGDPQGNAQDLTNLLGAILRIDVRGATSEQPYRIPAGNPFVGHQGGARPEIWAYGLRNPWRFSFDGNSEDLWAGDVGQNAFEEINLIKPGLNYGWNLREGFHCYERSLNCAPVGFEPPIIEYPSQGENCAVIGGYVSRDPNIPSLYGAYVYGDFCSGRIWGLRYDGVHVTEHLELVDSSMKIASFAKGPNGELYILSFDKKLYRLMQP